MAVPQSPVPCIDMIVKNDHIYYLFMPPAQSSVTYGTNYNSTMITGTGINTQGSPEFRRYNKTNGSSETIYINYQAPYYLGLVNNTSMILDESGEYIYMSRHTSPGNITNTHTSVTYDQAPSIIRYNIASGTCTGSNYEASISNTLDFDEVTLMHLNSVSSRITYATLKAYNNSNLSRYMSIIIRNSNLDYVEHHNFEIDTSYDLRPTDTQYYPITIGAVNYPAVLIDDSSYHLDESGLILFVPTRDFTAPFFKLTRRFMVLNYDDNSISYREVNNLDPTESSLGVKFYSDSTLDYVYTMDVLTGRVTALDPTNNYTIVNEWGLEDPVYDAATQCIFKSFAIRKTASNKIICYYITTATSTLAPGAPSTSFLYDNAFYDTKVCATRLIDDGTTGTIYSGYVNAPYGYPGMGPKVKLVADDPEGIYIAGNTVFRMCNLMSGE
jgi:hypothetical protein